MDILKYFYEEPMPLEALTSDNDPAARGKKGPTVPLEQLLNTPSYFRGYLAGTNMKADRIGLTALEQDEIAVSVLRAPGCGESWLAVSEDQTVRDVADPSPRFRDPSNTLLMVRKPSEELLREALIRVATEPRRKAIPALRSVLDACSVVYLREPAHDGFDWSLYSSRPLRRAIEATLLRHATPGMRRFVLPYQKARSEQKFYFERWQLNDEPLPDYIQEL